MADVEKKQHIHAADEDDHVLNADLDRDNAQLHKISSEDDARVRRKIDMVVLPMVSTLAIALRSALLLKFV